MLSRGKLSTFLLSRVICEFSVPIKDFSYKGVFYAARYGSSYYGALEKRLIPETTDNKVINQYKTLLQLYHKEGGLKKLWWYNTDSDNPLSKIKVELCDKGSGGGSVEFAYLDTPINAEDYFILMFKGENLYKGFVEKNVDFSKPVATLSPFTKRLKELLFNADYNNTIPFSMEVVDLLQDIIVAKAADSGINWNPYKVNLGTLEPILAEYNEDDLKYHIKYAHENPDSIISDLVSRGQNRYPGGDIENDFYVKLDSFNEITNKLYNYEDAFFKDVKVKSNEDKIKATEYAVYKKKDSNTEHIGDVGNEGNVLYPPLSISTRFRKIQGKITVPDVLSDSSALDYAYAQLKQETKFDLTISISGINIDRYIPAIGDWILIEGPWEKLYLDVNKCDDVSGWNNISISVGTGMRKSNCIKLFNTVGNISYLDFGNNKQWYKQEKISLYLKSAMSQRTIEVGFSKDLVTINYTKVFCGLSNIFEFHYIPYSDEFRYIVFRNTGTLPAYIFVDDIQVYCVGKKQYINRVAKISLDFSPDGINCDAELGDITDDESDESFQQRRKIRILETIAQAK